ncbi:MAG: hypothetical protein JNL67_08715 [Planctomycetaceae bacterium]|nr:hypothetical protein [Planctomycetaceae bacterium]
MVRQIIAVGLVSLFVYCGWYFWFGRERDWGPAVSAVFNASIESVNVSLFSPDEKPADSIRLGIDGPYRLGVTGTFAGPDRDDFILIAGQNLLFNLQIIQGDTVVWSNRESKIEPIGENGFSFSRKFRLPQDLPPGSYVLRLNYYRTNVASNTIQVIK